MATDLGAADAHLQDPPVGAEQRDDDRDQGPLAPQRLRWLLPLVVVVFAGALRFAYLPHPERIYFDETYYATNAAQLLEYGVEAEPRVASDPAQGVDPVFVVHPPVGKWLIAGGIAVFGDQSFGWRVASAVAGTLLVAATYFIALRLFRRRGVAALTAFLLSIEGLALTMSRIAMLDMFLALFVALGVWALLIDRDQRWERVGDPRDDIPGHVLRMSRPYLWLAGFAFGLALATKWSALLAIGAAGLYLLGSELAWRRALTGSPWRDLWRLAGVGVGALLIVPATVYVGSYAAWFANFERTRPGAAHCAAEPCAAGPAAIARGWYDEQVDILRFHRDLEVTHNYRAPAILWPLTKRPVVYYYEACLDDPEAECKVPPGTLEEIIGLGNPAIWWAALVVYPPLLYAGFWRRDAAAATIAVFLLGQFVPWLGPSRPLFFFYALPLVPFVVLALGWAATHLLDRRGLRWVPIGAAAVALAAFVFWSPIYYGMRISESAWRMRIWFNSWI